MWMMVDERKEATARLLIGGAIDAGSWPALQLLWLLYRNRAATGNLFADACSIQGWGMTPENSVVNGADTSTDGSIGWTALSSKILCCTTACEDAGNEFEDAQVLW
jgi:hypothetical protein